ncbi:uncharacterized protein LOC117654250 isoform X11 [Thrips palmi]|uniref:Uncharacterized protein LOC117654250 isoform X11 n=1 Tax=Thrips palmi TaxID=161013 RepID=A0A6P9AE17_THRPL|nr:uncharacterized protein LOC117654250 isoform X11 [Thrips palmi]XP_034256518.1 uncharacterized protein LOC117654250 isoform X11 [Thrips palmi]XP_034256519.1 uncharacterized protein LOC117654250 isoform X11 [Thrips palmi]XP_034256520.1 uncharacterized protein LOC117654250 isoform X11 [Thrips palmi]XP_034256521.1 uncharacterized protein LOC117654250 isoform X11 [Thrips palmi]XP_034256523.1 uncharacterized protein LOC117654250 isoform X11 [Thrips palmi]XP_034256524.1 uncharacterized protein LO
MECNICLEPFDATERRPKVLRCGHSYCVKCLGRLADKKCPVDMKVFVGRAVGLPDNFSILQNLEVPLPQRFWCISCEKEADAACVEDHPVRSLRKVRTQEALQRVKALDEAKAALASVRESVSAAAKGLKATLLREEQRLTARQGRLQATVGAEAAIWEQAKKDAALDGLPQALLDLSAAVTDPTAACAVTLRRGAAGDAAWRCEVRPAKDDSSSLLLCVLAASGQLQQEEQAEQASGQDASLIAPGWVETSNQADPLCRDRWHKGCRVKTAHGLGAISEVISDRYSTVKVKIDRSAQLVESYFYDMWPVLDPWGLICEVTPSALDALATSSSTQTKDKADLLASESLQTVLTLTGLDCSTSAPFCQQVLQRVAPRLERLQLVRPQQQHVDQALAMPRLHSLALVDVKKEWLPKVVAMESLRFLELHCKFEDALADPLPVFSRPAPPAGLRWLRCGFYPLRAALALARAHADTLEELQLVADTNKPYGCPDLALEVKLCGLKRLKRLVLQRVNAYGSLCGHEYCQSQKLALWNMFVGCGATVEVLCSRCDVSSMP